MKSWASSSLLGATWRRSAGRAALAAVLLAALFWALPARRAGEEGGHHGAPVAALDRFERAGVTEFTGNQRGPAFRLEVLGGATASLNDFRDTLVVLNFWATWCQPCTLEMPTLEALWRDYRERGLTVVGVSVDRGAPRALLEPYIRGHRLTFPILLDPESKTAGAWRVTALPATFLIRPGGEVAGVAWGAREWNSGEMKALVDTMLPGRRAPSR